MSGQRPFLVDGGGFWTPEGFAGFVVFVAGMFFRMNKNAREESQEYKARLIERRRNRRTETVGR